MLVFAAWLAAQLAEPVVVEEPAPPPPPPVVDKKPLRLAVYELKVDGVDEKLGHVVTDAVVLELRKLQRVSVVSMEEVRAMLDLETEKQLRGCASDSCLSDIADSLGVDGVVIGSLVHVGNERVFGLRRIDQREGKALGQVTRRLVPADGEEFLAAIGPAIEELFPDVALRPGAVRGVPPEVALRLNPPPLPPWVFWTTTATAGALGAVSLLALAGNAVTHGAVVDKQAEATSSVVNGAELNALRAQNDTVANVALGTAIAACVVGVAAAGTFLFTDFVGSAP